MYKKKLLLLLVLLTAFNIIHAIISEVSWRSYSHYNSLVVRSIGFQGLSISSDCTVTRNPILESIDECLGDLPAGYCYHLSCNLVGMPELLLPDSTINDCGG